MQCAKTQTSYGPPRAGTVGPASRPAAGAMLTLLRLSCSPSAAEANFLRPARDNIHFADARRIAVYTPSFIWALAVASAKSEAEREGIAIRRWRRQTDAADFGQPTASVTRWPDGQPGRRPLRAKPPGSALLEQEGWASAVTGGGACKSDDRVAWGVAVEAFWDMVPPSPGPICPRSAPNGLLNGLICPKAG